jgi:hypothetical protein
MMIYWVQIWHEMWIGYNINSDNGTRITCMLGKALHDEKLRINELGPN